MEWEREQKIIKYLNKIKNDIQEITPHINFIDDVPDHLRNARFEIIKIIGLLKLHKDNKNDKEETI